MNDRSTGFTTGCDLASIWGPQPHTHATPPGREADRSEGTAPGDAARNVVADKLARMVHVGLLVAGDGLPSERDLCEVFGVARQTVRAALGILEGRLMVAISHGRRSRVLGPGSLDQVDVAGALKRLQERRAADVFHALLLIDTEVAAQAVRHVTDRTLEQIDSLVLLLPRISRDPLCYQMLEHELRTLVYAACGNRLLADMAMDFYGYASRQRRRLLGDPQCLQRSASLQALLAAALHARDAQQVALVMKEQVEALAALPPEEPMSRGDAAPHVAEPSAAGSNAFRPVPPARGLFWPTP